MSAVGSSVLAFLVGAVGWTFAEYTLHRWMMHAMRGRGMASREHLLHHARRGYYAGAKEKGLTALASTLVMLPVSSAVVGFELGLALQVGFLSAYLAYEWLHRRAHTHAPLNGYGRWVRKHHFHHHFGHPLVNHGVSSPVWGLVFGTRVTPGVIAVPRRLVLPWMLGPDGELDPRFAADYRLVGRAETPVAEADHTAAFSNQPPPAG